ncbi:MAG: hypothetical protein II961_00900 [Candidatus Riflebacteria bacterium]|nr:hypothetical protein [Candidatus Riflebacteria bacterium]
MSPKTILLLETLKRCNCLYRKNYSFQVLKRLFANKLSVIILLFVFIIGPSVCCFAADKATPGSIIAFIFGIIIVVLFHLVTALITLTPIILIVYGLVIFPKLEKRRIKDYVEKNHLKYIEKISKLPNNLDIDFMQFNGSKSFEDTIIFQKDSYSCILTNLNYNYTSSKGKCGTFPLPLLIIVDKNQNFPFFYLKDAYFEKNIEQRCAYSGSKHNIRFMEEEYRKRLSFYRGYNLVMEEDPEFEERYSLEVDENCADAVKKFFGPQKRSIFNELDNKFFCYEGNGNLFIICSAIEITYFKDKIKFMEKGIELYNKIMY